MLCRECLHCGGCEPLRISRHGAFDNGCKLRRIPEKLAVGHALALALFFAGLSFGIDRGFKRCAFLRVEMIEHGLLILAAHSFEAREQIGEVGRDLCHFSDLPDQALWT